MQPKCIDRSATDKSETMILKAVVEPRLMRHTMQAAMDVR